MLIKNFLFAFISQKEIAQLTCECERHIGTQSGGMDQVIVTVSFSFVFFLCVTSAINYLNP